MALIIKGEMPKGKCWWHDEQGKEHECQFFPCNAIYCLDPEDRKEKCLIIGEIPNKHGRLIDADSLLNEMDSKVMDEDRINGLFDFAFRCVSDAPTILEASDGN